MLLAKNYRSQTVDYADDDDAADAEYSRMTFSWKQTSNGQTLSSFSTR